MLQFTGERLVPGAANCEPTFAAKMYHEHLARYRFAAQLVRGRRVLDVGCGVGYGSAALADAGAAEVVAFDVSADAVEHARSQFARATVDYRVASAEDFDFGTFDVVTCFELIEHVEDQDAVLERIGHALAASGTAFVSTPRPQGEHPRSLFHVHELDFDAFRALLERRFRSTRYWFEVNQLGSRIDVELGSDDADVALLVPGQLQPANADYFVAVVGHEPGDEPVLRPVQVLGDDAYVLNLEKDVGVLRESETRLVSQLEARRPQAEPLADAFAAANRRLLDRVRRAERAAERAEARRRAAEEHARAMTETLSWRVTSPLRLVRTTLTHASSMRARALSARDRRGTAGLVAEASRRAIRTVRSRPRAHDPWSDVPLTPADELGQAAADSVDVVFLIGCLEGQSKRYRVGNVAEGLRELGFRVLVLDASDVGLLLEHEIVPDRLVVFRAVLGDRVEAMREIFRRVRRRGGQVIADFDDLVFEPSIVGEIDGFQLLPESSRAEYVQGVLGYRELILETDAVLCPTAFLADRVRQLGVPAAVVRNSLDHAQLAIADEADASARATDEVVIGYFSGSRTHQRDFAQAAPAIERLLTERADVRLLIVGHLDLPETWQRFGARILQKPFMPYTELMQLTKSIDINVAPLVVGDPFCEAKSELKIFEAGAVGVPTVASRTSSYAAAIDDGVDGFLAQGADDWYGKLLALVDSPDLRLRLGEAARQRSLETYGYRNAAADFVQATSLQPPERARTTSAPEERRIAWIIPGLLIGGGGHRNILRAAYQFEQLGYGVDLYFTEWDRGEKELNELIHRHFFPLSASARRYTGRIDACDVIFATHWSTVEPALANRSAAREIMYYVQDFEPWFYPMGSDYLLAENTYKLGLYHITTGPWCTEILRTKYGAEADYFQFPVDTSTYFPRGRRDARTRLLFFAKPEMPRRCYSLGVRALAELHRLRPDVEIVFFGSENVDARSLPFPVTPAGILDQDQLAELYSSADVGVVFSPTNPSLVPYEMMACGLVVVDIGGEYSALNYGGDGDVVLLVDLDPARMAAQIADLLADEEQRAARSERGREFVKSFPTEQEMGEIVRGLVEARLAQLEPDRAATSW
jgi:glycosyltransferase involved in cell wall biosynthesis/SAM-dependent methyltransferase